MPQLILPLIPEGATQISDLVTVYRSEDRWTYYMGLTPIYAHAADDHRLFRLISSMMIDAGTCRHKDIIETFGVSKSNVNRALKKLREGGPEAFFQRKPGGRKGHILTLQVLEQAQALLDHGVTRHDAAEQLGVKIDTLRKAINDGRLHEHQGVKAAKAGTDKSSRSVVDTAAAKGMGTACTRVTDRALASIGKGEAQVRFELCLDVPKAGVLCAVPALLANGILEGAEKLLGKISGYYTIFQILLVLAFMTLCRIKTVERLRENPPGEFGKLLGLDRIPEARCLREKMDALSEANAADIWAAHLSKHWMQDEPDAAGTLYVDGHVRVYHGKLTKLPRRYVTRQRLCLRGTTDYWVNDAIGRPFFLIEKPIDPGLIQVVEHDIVPRLLDEVPNQPDKKALAANAHLCRFVLVFDREGYSPDFFARMWRMHRIACITYHKHPAEPWPENWFKEQTVIMPGGETFTMRLAEMGSLLGSGKKNTFWVREVRKLTDSGHQTSLISTAYDLPQTQLAVRMFSRWCQENFFRYMKQHFEIDMLCEYGVVEIPDTEKVVNPSWRELNRGRNQVQSRLRYRRARFTEMTMHPESETAPEKYQKWLKRKSELLEEIDQHEHQLATLKAQLKQTPKHITWGELEDKDKFNRLLPGRKRLMDTVRMIAYRAETAMAAMLLGPTVDMPDARRLLQGLFVADADLLPDMENNRLCVRIHNASTPADNRSIASLLEKLNKAEIEYPGSKLRLVYELVNSDI